MKLLYTLTALLFLASCSNNTAPVENNENPETTETVQAAEKEKATNTTSELLLGTWAYENPNMPIVQIITYNEDGTYAMQMGDRNISGTWELTDNVLITKSSPEAPGQKKTITKIDATTLATFWEPADGGAGREMVYTRK